MDVNEKAIQAIQKAEKYELYPGFDSGLMLVYDKLNDEPDLREATVGQLLKSAPHVRRKLEERARTARAKELIGQPVWSYEDGVGTVAGTLTDVDQGNGKLIILVPAGSQGGQTRVVADPERLFILAKEKSAGATEVAAETAAIPANAEAAAEKAPRRRLLEIIGDTLGGKEK